MNEATITALVFLLGLAFGAGGAAAALRGARKQINGVGQRLNRAVAVIIHLCPPDERERLTLQLLGVKKDGD